MKRAGLWLAFAAAGAAHVGSPDVFFEGAAGPYPLFVTIRPPAVIPGVAEIEIRTSASDVREVHITPLPLTGEGAKFAPTPDLAARSKDDPQFFTGSLWMMQSGAWQVRVSVTGDRGEGRLAVPVPAVALRTQGMQATLGAILFGLMILLSWGAVSIAGAGAREARLEPGAEPRPEDRRRGRRVMAATAAVVIGVLYLGNLWWKAEAGAYDRYIYKPLEMSASLEEGRRLVLRLRDPGWLSGRRLDDFLPDHTHLMHLFALRMPELDRVFHLHPRMTASGVFTHDLPDMPAGRYQLFADVVHKSGFPETMVAEIDLPDVAGGPVTGDDSAGGAPPVSAADYERVVAVLSGGSRMFWQRPTEPVVAKRAQVFRFQVADPDGKPATDLELYMGMPGHAAFVRADRKVFAHVHPSGSVPMASLALVAEDPHAGHAAVVPPTIGFPYGFPEPGSYRIFVQVRKSGKVETGVFDVNVQ
jgi:hypothetical protein